MIVLACLSVLLVVTPAAPVRAAETCDQINAELDQMWNNLEPLIEQYNGVHEQLLADQAKAKKLQQQLNPLQLQVDLAMSRVGAISAQLYMGGKASALNAILTSGSPTTLVDQLATLDQLARGQRKTISQTLSMQQKLAGDKAPLDATIADEAQKDSQLASQKKTIEAQQKVMQDKRLQACGIDPSGNSLRIGSLCPAENFGGPGNVAATFACNQIGKPYVWAAAGPKTYDCSGLTMAAWKAAGYTLAHYTVTQKAETTRVTRADLKPGDLVFFFSDVHHVGIYVGNGLMVHAPHTGDYVRMQYIDAMPINSYGRVHYV
jgi:peptidoglycan DL-endopeptidase CwlO